jgi:hypothetical protein
MDFHSFRQIRSDVFDPLGHAVHQDVVVHAIKELLQVHIRAVAMARLDKTLRSAHSLMRALSRTKTIAILVKCRIPEWLEDLKNALLNQPIKYGGNTQLSHSTRGLRDLHFPYGGWMISTIQEFLPDSSPVGAEP